MNLQLEILNKESEIVTTEWYVNKTLLSMMAFSFNTIQSTCYTRFSPRHPDDNLLKLCTPHTEHKPLQRANQHNIHLDSSWVVDCLALVEIILLALHSPTKEWRLGCWPLWQDWPNTRWTSGWPETCSWRLRSGSHTDLSETEFPLYLKDTSWVLTSEWKPSWTTSLTSEGRRTSVGPVCAGRLGL